MLNFPTGVLYEKYKIAFVLTMTFYQENMKNLKIVIKKNFRILALELKIVGSIPIQDKLKTINLMFQFNLTLRLCDD